MFLQALAIIFKRKLNWIVNNMTGICGWQYGTNKLKVWISQWFIHLYWNIGKAWLEQKQNLEEAASKYLEFFFSHQLHWALIEK